MTVSNETDRFFESEGIELYGAVPLSECHIINPELLSRRAPGLSADKASAIVFAVPYLSESALRIKNGISVYAFPDDYHIYFSELFGRFENFISEEYKDRCFCGFADHSPIDEVHAAALCGIGSIGDNGLIITEKYSSFVFIGEIITDADIQVSVKEISFCIHCGNCSGVCPSGIIGCADSDKSDKNEFCLSAVTQKKHDLSENETALIQKNKAVWGCDRCQFACPFTKSALKNNTVFTKIPWFLNNTSADDDIKNIDSMPKSVFRRRAYSWRGKKTILRNIELNRLNDSN